jgi:hypothetical protein
VIAPGTVIITSVPSVIVTVCPANVIAPFVLSATPIFGVTLWPATVTAPFATGNPIVTVAV